LTGLKHAADTVMEVDRVCVVTVPDSGKTRFEKCMPLSYISFHTTSSTDSNQRNEMNE